MTTNEQKNESTVQTVLNISPLANIRKLYYLSWLGIAISGFVCFLFLSFLIFNYLAPYRLNDLEKRIEQAQAETRNDESSTNENGATVASNDFIMDGLSTEEKSEAVDLPVSQEKYSFLMLPNEVKEYIDLKKRLINDPNNAELQTKLRFADVLLREEFFQRRRNAENGSFLLLLAGVCLILFAKTAAVLNRRLPVPESSGDCPGVRKFADDFGRKAVFAGIALIGVLAVGTTFGLFLSGHSELETFLADKIKEIDSSVAVGETPENPVAPPSNPDFGATVASTNSNVPDSDKLEIGSIGSENSSKPVEKSTVAVVEEPAVDPSGDRDAFSAAWNQNWPVFRGPFESGRTSNPADDAKILAVSNESNVSEAETAESSETKFAVWDFESQANILWESPVSLEGHNSPIVWGERLFLTGASETERKVSCYHTKTGTLLWETPIPFSSEAAKTLQLNHDTGFAPSTAATDGRRVYAIFPDGDLVALDYEGKIVWTKSFGVPENHYGFAASLALWFDRVLIQFDVDRFRMEEAEISSDAENDASTTDADSSNSSGESKLVAVKSDDGSVLWETARPDARGSWASPVVQKVGDQDQILVMGDPYFAAYDPESGREFWRYSGFQTDVTPSPIAVGSTVYAVNESQFFAAFDGTGSGELDGTDRFLWKAQSSGLPNAASPLPVGNRIFLLAENGTLTGLDVEKQESFCELFVDEGDSFYASPILIGRYIYLFSKNPDEANVYIIDADRLTPEKVNLDLLDLVEVENALVAKIPLPEPIFASPAFKDGRLFLRGRTRLWALPISL